MANRKDKRFGDGIGYASEIGSSFEGRIVV